MYVCVCNAITDREISASIAQGATSFRELRDTLGVATCCGKCGPEVKRQLKEELACGNHCACAGLLQPA